MKIRRSSQSLLALMTALLLTLAAVLIPASAANAHDELTGTVPESGATVAQVPEEVRLTFSGTPQRIGSEFKVTDTDGTEWAEGDLKIVDNSVTQELKPGAPAGQYTVSWRVVSADAHPIEGAFSFTASGGPTATAGTSEPIETVAPEPLQNVTGGEFPWGITIMIVVLVGLGVTIAVTARRRLNANDDDE